MNQDTEKEGAATELRPQEGLDLSDREKKEIKRLGRPKAVIIHEAIRIEGESQLRSSFTELALSGLAAGLSMGFSIVAEGLIHASLPDQPWRPLISNLGYSVGFLIVVMGRQQLFTEKTLSAVLPLLNRFNLRNLKRVLRLWIVVLLSNLVGTYLFVWILGHTDTFTPEVRHAFTQIGHAAMAGGFWTILQRGIFAGWLIALMVWLLPAAESSRLWVIIIITYLVGLGGLAHSIAGSVEVLYLVATGTTSWGAYFGGFMVPALLGNIFGGVTLVAVLNYGQVAPQTK